MLIYKHETGELDFKFEYGDWDADRAMRFLAEFKFAMPNECRNYNRRGQVWTVDANWVDVFDRVRAKFRLAHNEQDEPFAVIRRAKDPQLSLFELA
ncbi:MAG: hypothetical protein MOB07_24285 [Acidobacteria bacterium]|nr:hypothetical protein [Acidobacteriota bacterium]